MLGEVVVGTERVDDVNVGVSSQFRFEPLGILGKLPKEICVLSLELVGVLDYFWVVDVVVEDLVRDFDIDGQYVLALAFNGLEKVAHFE